jgi:hypothetical protein
MLTTQGYLVQSSNGTGRRYRVCFCNFLGEYSRCFEVFVDDTEEIDRGILYQMVLLV